MADDKFSVDEMLNHFGDYDSLCLDNVTDGSEDEKEIDLFNSSPYYPFEEFSLCLKKGEYLKILSLKSTRGSINATFDSFFALLEIAQHQNV